MSHYALGWNFFMLNVQLLQEGEQCIILFWIWNFFIFDLTYHFVSNQTFLYKSLKTSTPRKRRGKMYRRNVQNSQSGIHFFPPISKDLPWLLSPSLFYGISAHGHCSSTRVPYIARVIGSLFLSFLLLLYTMNCLIACLPALMPNCV